MSKKFSFNFKFLDRFKKKSVDEAADQNEYDEENLEDSEETLDSDDDYDTSSTENTEENEQLTYKDEDPNLESERIRNSLQANFSLDDSDESEENNKPFSLDSNDDKTDPSFNLNEMPKPNLKNTDPQNEIVNLDDLVKLHREKIEAGEEIETSHDETQHDIKSFIELKNAKIDDLLESAQQKQQVKFFSFKERFQRFTNKDGTVTTSEQAPENHKFDWSQIILRIFSPYNRHRIHALFIIAFLGTVTYLVGKNGALLLGLIKSPEPKKISRPNSTSTDIVNTSQEDIAKVTHINLFNAKNSEQEVTKGPKIDIDSIVCTSGESLSALPLKLMDTVVLQDSVKSVAAVQIRGRTDLLNIREGERLETLAEVSRINRLSVVLKNLETGACEYIGNSDDATAPMPANMKILSPQKGKALLNANNPEIKSTGNNFKISKTYRNKMLANINQILTEAKAVQITNPDGTLAYKMTEVIPGSIYSQLNIQENDIITHINGKKIENLNELMSLLGRIKEIDQFQLTLKRNGMNENLEYNFE